MTLHAFSSSMEIGGNEIDIEVMYEYYPPLKGARDEYGAPIEPDEPASVRITRIDAAGIDAANDAIGDWLLEVASDDFRDGLEEAALENIQS
jgi:hypothetical protein